MIGHRCINCLWWDNKHDSLDEFRPKYGYCRKHKPIPAAKGERYMGEWPIVNEFDFCGEFREDT